MSTTPTASTYWNSASDLRERLKRLQAAGQVQALLQGLPTHEMALLLADWPLHAHEAQRPPLGNWRNWLLMGGRGAGKTRSGAEWIRHLVAGDPHYAGDAAGRVALVGETHADARAVMVEGESGLLAICGDDRPQWSPSMRQLRWANGTVGQLFSAADPEGLRGSQFGAAWCDEIAKWAYPDDTWDMLQFCLRLGHDPRIVATTTPKPLALLKRLLADKATVVTHAPTTVNAAHLAPGFLDYLRSLYGGTRLGRQELDGALIEDRDDGLWRRDRIEADRVMQAPPMQRIIIGLDPPAGSKDGGASCGIVAAGRGVDERFYVLADASLPKATPLAWANAAVALFNRLEADAIVAEANQGGEMVTQTLRQVDPAVPVRDVRASRGKWLRAEPVALLYEKGRVSHAGRFGELEDEMCAFGADGSANGRSPDRLDALVWALTTLAFNSASLPRVRGL